MQDDDTIGQAERVTVSRAALRLELLEMEVRLKEFFNSRVSIVEADVRALQAINASRTAAEHALAIETERRREALADGHDMGARRIALVVAAAGVCSSGWWIPQLFHLHA